MLTAKCTECYRSIPVDTSGVQPRFDHLEPVNWLSFEIADLTREHRFEDVGLVGRVDDCRRNARRPVTPK
jgi:hypothetical protein